MPHVGSVTWALSNSTFPTHPEVCAQADNEAALTYSSANAKQHAVLKVILRPRNGGLTQLSLPQKASLQQGHKPTAPTLNAVTVIAWDNLLRHIDNGVHAPEAVQPLSELPAVPSSSQDRSGSPDTLVASPPQRSRSSSPGWENDENWDDKHRAVSEQSWHIYLISAKDEQAKAVEQEWAAYVQWLRFLHEAEVAELHTELFAAEATVQARDVEIANDYDDYQANLDALKEERDEAEKKLSERVEELDDVRNRLRNSEHETKVLRGERDEMRRNLQTWQQRTKEAMEIAESLKADLNAAQEERAVLATGSSAAKMIQDQTAQIQILQTNLQHHENEKNEFRGAFEFLMVKYSEEQEKNTKLQIDMHYAGLEVGYIHLLNIGYRDALEDQPERAAHLDALLKRKDEVYNDIAQRYDECAEQRAEQQRMRNIDREHFSGVQEELYRQIAGQKQEIEELKRSRDIHQKQNEEICDMFTRKIFKEDMVKAINAEHEILKKDNASLIKMVRSREVRVQEVIAEIAPLKMRIVELENALETSTFKQRELQAEANGLNIRKCNLEVALETQEGDAEQKIKELEAQLQAEKQQLEGIIKDAASPSIQRYLDVKNREIENLRAERNDFNEQRWNWYHRAIELQADFDPVLDANRVNIGCEGREVRFRVAERMLKELEGKLKERGIWEEIRGAVDPRCRELEEVERFLGGFARGGNIQP